MNDAGRIGFVIKGDYSSSTTYEFLDVVYYRNATYIARKTTTGVLPTVTTDWFCAMNADIEGLVHVAVVNPNGTEYGANWLMKDGVVLTPQAEDIYRVLVGGKERMFFWNGTQYETLSGGGHTIQNTSGTALTQRDNLQFKDMSVSDDSTNNKTVIRQTQVVATKAEWDAMTPDPNVTYYLPWMSNTEYAEDRTPIGTVISVTTAKTGEVTGITTPTGEFPSSDYLVCDGAVKNIADYPKLADWFLERYGSKNYFGGNGTTTFAVPNFSADFPTNGILSIKAQMTSTQVTYAEVNDSLTTENNVWSAEKVNTTLAKNLVYNWQIVDAAVSTTATTVNTTNGRQFSKVETLIMYVVSGGLIRAGLPLPRSVFVDGTIVSLSWVNSANVQKWVEIQYVSDTSVKAQKSTNESDTTFIKIYGLGGSESPF